MSEAWRTYGGYLAIAFALAVFALRFVHSLRVRRRIPELMRAGAQLVDVRSAGEFAAGHVAGSRNIPIAEIDRRADELDKNRWVILCCASGTRSGMALARLRRRGFAQVLNGGSWRNFRTPPAGPPA